MHKKFAGISAGALLLAVGIIGEATIALVSSAQVSAQNTFRDVKPDYWATPFIQALAKKGMVAGYKDGTFRPEKPVERDEFAAMIRQAFEEKPVRSIPSGSAFKDVPQGYWAEPPIEEAYETGFMQGTPDNKFLPQKPLSRTQAFVVLMQGLNMSPKAPETTAQATTNPVASAPATSTSTPQSNQRQVAAKPLVFPLASTAMMAPFLNIVSQKPIQKAVAATSQKPAQQAESSTPAKTANKPKAKLAAADVLNLYYQDAEKIPKSAVNDVATATQANIVVNYPDTKLFNPDKLLNRGAAAAIIHQALVNQGKLEPLPKNVAASKYIVDTTAKNNQTAQVSK